MDVAIESESLTKRYGRTLAVDHLSFSVRYGRVTGFVGPNGAGKSTTMRLLLGLDASDGGRILVNGRRYTDLASPLREVGALLDANATHPGRRARNHLVWLATSNSVPKRRVDEVLELVGLTDVARRRAGGFSLGMAQRLGIAAALLGDPPVVVLDEPANGLDPEGILWIRSLLRSLASEGRAIFVSSHLMNELEGTADDLVVIGRGRLIASTTVTELLVARPSSGVLVRTSEPADLMALLVQIGGTVTTNGNDSLIVSGLESARVAEVASSRGLPLYELTPQRATLEEAFMHLTRDAVEFAATHQSEHQR